MDDLERDLTTLLRERADATDVPHLPLDSVLARGELDASRTRRRNGLIAVIAAAAVVAAIAIPVGVQSLRTSSPSPAAPLKSTSTSTDAALGFIRTIGQPSSVAVGDDGAGAYATLWSRCGAGSGGQPCQVAWMMQENVVPSGDVLADATTYAGWAPSDAQIVAAGDDFVVTSYASDQGFVIHPDGSTADLRLLRSATPGPDASTASTVVDHSSGVRVVDIESATWQTVTNETGKAFDRGAVAGGMFWGERVHGSVEVAAYQGDGLAVDQHITAQPQAASGPIAASGSSVAVAVSDEDSRGGPMTAWLIVSTNGGSTFTNLSGSELTFDAAITSMVSSNDGVLFVSTYDGTVYRSTDDTWTHFAPVPDVTGRVLQPVGGGSVLVLGTGTPGGSLILVGHDGSSGAYGPTLSQLVPPGPIESASANASPASLDELPMGALPKVPYLRGGLVVMNGIPTAAPHAISILAAGGVVVIGGDRDDQGDTTFWVYRGDGGWHRAPWLGTAAPPVLDPSGRYAAVATHPDDSTTRITLVDPQTGHEYGHTDLDIPYVSCCGGGQLSQLLGIDAYGNVYWMSYDKQNGSDGLWRWAPHQVATRLGDAQNAVAVNALGVVMKHANEPGVLYLVRADQQGHELPASAADGVWSSDGHRMLVGSTVIDVETGAEYPMALPPQMAVTPLGFEDDDTVELLVHNSGAVYPDEHPASILRCFVATQTCERAEDLSDLKRTQFPESF